MTRAHGPHRGGALDAGLLHHVLVRARQPGEVVEDPSHAGEGVAWYLLESISAVPNKYLRKFDRFY